MELSHPRPSQCRHLSRNALTSMGCSSPRSAGLLIIHYSPWGPAPRATCGSEGEEEENWGCWLGTPFSDFTSGCQRGSFPLPAPGVIQNDVVATDMIHVLQSSRAASTALGPCGRLPLHGKLLASVRTTISATCKIQGGNLYAFHKKPLSFRMGLYTFWSHEKWHTDLEGPGSPTVTRAKGNYLLIYYMGQDSMFPLPPCVRSPTRFPGSRSRNFAHFHQCSLKVFSGLRAEANLCPQILNQKVPLLLLLFAAVLQNWYLEAGTNFPCWVSL